MTNADEIVLYQPNDTIHLEVRMAEESVWLTQQQIALLFGVKQPAISKHLTNIFNSGELEEDSVHSILEYTAAYGKMYKTKFYNLDAILSVGYRVNSINATMFRKWVNKVLKDYSINQRTAARQPIRTHTRPHTNTLARPFPMRRRHRLPHRGVAEGLGQEMVCFQQNGNKNRHTDKMYRTTNPELTFAPPTATNLGQNKHKNGKPTQGKVLQAMPK